MNNDAQQGQNSIKVQIIKPKYITCEKNNPNSQANTFVWKKVCHNKLIVIQFNRMTEFFKKKKRVQVTDGTVGFQSTDG